MILKRCTIITALLLAFIAAAAQSPNDDAAKRALQVGHTMQQERVFLHFDNSAYYLGETIWFKAYLSYGTNDRITTPSKVLYVELVAPEGYIVETKKYKIDENGCCNGEFDLNPLLLSGYYEVRAYTRYMLNWGKDAVFSRVFPVFDKVNGDNWDFRNMLDRKRGFKYRGEWISSELPDADLKFYPEGGHLVAGLANTVAYELRGIDGEEIDNEITIYADKEALLKTKPAHMGKGTFAITPQSGVKYTAKVIARNKKGKEKEFEFDLPETEPYGVTLHAEEQESSITFTVKSNRTEDDEIAFGILYRGALGFYKKIAAEDKAPAFTIEKNELPEGVNKAIVFSGITPLAERCFFVMHDSAHNSDRSTARLVIKGNNQDINNLSLAPYEKITLNIAREDGKPISGDAELSLAVSDRAGEVTTSWNHNIYTYLLLGSELKGYIPNAAQYFDKQNTERNKQLDLLMLTNGWTAYDWSILTQKKIDKMQPIERGITLKGAFFRKNHRTLKTGEGRKTELLPQKDNLVRFDISYDGEAVSTNTFRTDSMGEFIIETKEFYGEKTAALQPQTTLRQNNNILYTFALDRYFSPEFRLYNYWERNIGMPIKKEEKAKLDSMIRLNPFEYMLSSVEVVSDAKKEAKSRPPHSEMRFNYLDEWEYAQDVTYLKEFESYKDNVYRESLEELGRNIALTKDIRPDTMLSISDFENSAGIITMEKNLNADFVKYVGYMRYTYKEDDSPQFTIKEEYKRSLTAADVVSSAMIRHNYNWAYWVQLMVVLGEYDSKKTPQPDYDYLQGVEPEKMTNFKEFVIRSDIKTREQFENTLNYWGGKGRALDNKTPAQKFYMGFLSQHYVAGGEGIDNCPSYSTLLHDLTSKMEVGIKDPKHPNYVACFIPYSEDEKRNGIIPDLTNSTGVTRYTSIKGYNESKQFYSPDYSNARPTDKKDYRRTLLWNPQIKAAQDGTLQIELFNSSNCNNVNVEITGRDSQTLYSSKSNFVTRINNNTRKQTKVATGDNAKGERDEDFINIKMDPDVERACAKQHQLALVYYNQKKYNKAIVLWAELAKYKYAPALKSIAMCYQDGTGLKKNLEQTMRFYEDAARHGDSEAQYDLSQMYRNGIGCTANDSLAQVWMRRALMQKEPRAMIATAKDHIARNEHSKAREYMQEAASTGYAAAIYEYARYIEAYPAQSGVTDNNTIVELMRTAAEKEHREAQIYIMEHEYAAENYTEVYRIARELSLAKRHEGTKRMADCYFFGLGVKRDKKLAKDLYRTAANEGNKEAEEIIEGF